jgi:Uma2 family endonuclease
VEKFSKNAWGEGINLCYKFILMKVIDIIHTSPQEYLVFERSSQNKHEYYDGQVSAMAGASMAHNHIVSNVIREVGNLLKGKRCMVLPSDMRTCTPTETAYMYPDALVVCGEPEMADDRFDTLKNPVVIFEVLSPSTRDHDRQKKFHFYKQIPSFREYILIDSMTHFVEIHRRQQMDLWNAEATADPGGHFFISSIRHGVLMEEIYRNVKFPSVKP